MDHVDCFVILCSGVLDETDAQKEEILGFLGELFTKQTNFFIKIFTINNNKSLIDQNFFARLDCLHANISWEVIGIGDVYSLEKLYRYYELFPYFYNDDKSVIYYNFDSTKNTSEVQVQRAFYYQPKDGSIPVYLGLVNLYINRDLFYQNQNQMLSIIKQNKRSQNNKTKKIDKQKIKTFNEATQTCNIYVNQSFFSKEKHQLCSNFTSKSGIYCGNNLKKYY